MEFIISGEVEYFCYEGQFEEMEDGTFMIELVSVPFDGSVRIKDPDTSYFQSEQTSEDIIANPTDDGMKSKPSRKKSSFFNCPICPFTSKRKYLVKGHIDEVHSEISISFDVRSVKNKEIDTPNIQPEKTSNTTDDGIESKSSSIFSCALCPYTTRRQYFLKRHTDKVHSDISVPFDDNSNEKEKTDTMNFQSEQKLEENTLNPNDEGIASESSSIFSCNLCRYTTKRQYFLKRHTEKVHLNISVPFDVRSVENENPDTSDIQSEKTSEEITWNPTDDSMKSESSSFFSYLDEVHLKISAPLVEKSVKNEYSDTSNTSEENTSNPNHEGMESESSSIFSCNLCHFTTKRQYFLKRHTEKVHLNISFPFEVRSVENESPDTSNIQSEQKSEEITRNPTDDGMKSKSSSIFSCLDEVHLKSSVPLDEKSDKNKEAGTFNFQSELKSEENTSNTTDEGIKSESSSIFSCSLCRYTTKRQYFLKRHTEKVHLNISVPFDVRSVENEDPDTSNIQSDQTTKEIIWNPTDDGMKSKLSSIFSCLDEVHSKISVPLDERSVKNENSDTSYFQYEQTSEEITSISTAYSKESKTSRKKSLLFSCPLCDYTTNRQFLVKRHTDEVHSNIKKFSCDHCEFSTNRKWNFDKHIKTVHSDESKIYNCEYCKFSTSSVDYLKEHTNRMHLQQSDLRCEFCSYKTNFPSSLRRHVSSVHDKKQYSCDLCDFTTKYPTNLNRHIKGQH